MKNSILACLLLFVTLFSACKDGPPILPGLTKSKIVLITVPDSNSIKLNNSKLNSITPYVIDDLDPGFYRIDLSYKFYYDSTIYHILNRDVTDTLFVEMREIPVYWWDVYNTSNSQIPTNNITRIKTDNFNNIWMGTPGSGLLKFDGTNFTTYDKSNSGIQGDFINDIYIDNNNIWIATENGFSKFDGVNWLSYNSGNINIPDNNITAITKDLNGIFWIGTLNGGLIKFDGTDVTVYDYSNSGIPSNYISTLSVDKNNLIWIGTWGAGVATFDGVNWNVYNSFFGDFINSYITKIIRDRDGNIWIGSGSETSTGGLTKHDENGFTDYTYLQSELPGTFVTDIALDLKAGIWISTNNGLAKLEGERWRIYNTSNSLLSSNNIRAIAVDLNNNKWMSSEGLIRYRGQKE